MSPRTMLRSALVYLALSALRLAAPILVRLPFGASIVFLLLRYLPTPPSTSSTTAPAPGPIDPAAAPSPPIKRYDLKAKRYSEQSGTWEDVQLDAGATGVFLFTAVKKTWPKGPRYEAYQDSTDLFIHSKALIRVVREDVPELKASEAAYEDEPAVRDDDLFHAEEETRQVLERKKRLLSGEEAEEAAATAEETKEQAPEEEEEKAEPAAGPVAPAAALDTAEDGDVRQQLEPAEKTKEELAEEVDHLQILVEWLDEQFGSTRAKLRRLLRPTAASPSSVSKPNPTAPADSDSDHPQISFALLRTLFKRNSLAVGEHELSGEKYAFQIHSTAYIMTRDGMVFDFVGKSLGWSGSKYRRNWVRAQIPKFQGLRRISSLSVTPLQPASKLHDELTARGKRYCELTGAAGEDGGRFLNYDGAIMFFTGSGHERKIVKLRAERRAVVDIKSYHRMNPTQSVGKSTDPDDDFPASFLWGDVSLPSNPTSASPSSLSSIAPSEFCLLPPTVQGFSLVQRQWGDLLVTGFRPLEFRD
ncbi:hypothetical protein JCM8097_008314 [Rhodosporidiobolus ruineniae]